MREGIIWVTLTPSRILSLSHIIYTTFLNPRDLHQDLGFGELPENIREDFWIRVWGVLAGSIRRVLIKIQLILKGIEYVLVNHTLIMFGIDLFLITRIKENRFCKL